MKMLRSILITFLCGIGILVIGYTGIVIGGKQILRISTEPEPVTMKGNISGMFYSRIEDDIQLYPWNYYPETIGESFDTDRLANTDESINPDESSNIGQFADLDQPSAPFWEYSLFLENDVFYMLIALAADVDPQEVSHWYSEQGKTIMMNMVQGQDENGPIDIYFYEEEVRLSGKTYQVRISCNEWCIISFSCIQQREEDVKETKEWQEQKENFAHWMEKNPDMISLIYNYMYGLHIYYYDTGKWGEWSRYVELYRTYLNVIHDVHMSGDKNETEKLITEIIAQTNSGLTLDKNGELRIQMIELKDSLLLVAESEVTIGIYYDVLKQQVTGFHFFWE